MKNSQGVNDNNITKEQEEHFKREKRQGAMTLIDFRKAYDIILSTWILEYLKMYKISERAMNFIWRAMESWRVGISIEKRILTELDIQRRIFEGVSLSLLLFVITMMLLN